MTTERKRDGEKTIKYYGNRNMCKCGVNKTDHWSGDCRKCRSKLGTKDQHNHGSLGAKK